MKIFEFVYQLFRSLRYTFLQSGFGVVSHCPHHPTCGTYGIRKIREQGIVVGGASAIFRVLRCW